MARADIIQAIWQQSALPAVTPFVTQSVASPIASVGSLLRCDRLTLDMGGGHVNYSYLHLTSATAKGRLVVVIQGHTTTYDEIGVGDVVRSLVPKGYDVLVLGMPGKCGNGGSSDHNAYAQMESPTLNPLRYFLEPGVAALNLLAGNYSDVTMTGISGGGWTTTVLAALDPRVKLSIPCAGSLPWYLRSPNSLGDWEQSRVNQIAAYPVLYLLGCDSAGRRQVQVLDRNDSCCFAYTGTNGSYGTCYQPVIDNWLGPIAASMGGSFAFREDTSHSSHLISPWTIANVILPELGEPVPLVVTLDDGDSGHSFTGSWTGWHPGQGVGAENAINTDYWTAPSGSGDRKSRWGLSLPAGSYTVKASFVAHTNRATNALFRIYDGTTLLGTVTASQRDTFTGLLSWATLGTWTTTGELAVELSNEGADGYLCADALKVEGV